MYKVFIHQTPIVISSPQDWNEVIPDNSLSFQYHDIEDFQVAVDLLNRSNTDSSTPLNCIYLYTPAAQEALEEIKTHLTHIQAGGGLVKDDQGDLLFIYRLNKWDLPKGKLEKGETPEQGALREVEEECGIDGLRCKAHLINTYHIYWEGDKTILKETFWYTMSVGGTPQLVPQAEENITKAEWKSENDLEEVLNNTYSNIKEVIKAWKKS